MGLVSAKRIRKRSWCLVIASRLQELEKVERFSEQVARQSGLTTDESDNLAIAVTEAVGNAITHGNKRDPAKTVEIVFDGLDNGIRVRVSDQGCGFDPSCIANPLDPENLMKESGRGIFILKTLMSDVRFDITPRGSSIIMSLTHSTSSSKDE
jgi:serine/threonine-protein kinase RsbW